MATCIPRVDGLSTDPRKLGRHIPTTKPNGKLSLISYDGHGFETS